MKTRKENQITQQKDAITAMKTITKAEAISMLTDVCHNAHITIMLNDEKRTVCTNGWVYNPLDWKAITSDNAWAASETVKYIESFAQGVFTLTSDYFSHKNGTYKIVE